MLKKLGLSKKVLLPIVIIFPIVIVGTSVYISGTLEKNTIEAAISSAENTIEQYKLLRAYYTREVAGKVNSSGSMKVNWEHSEPNTIPLPATMIHELSKELEGSKSGLRLSLYSDKPFPNRANRKLDAFQQDALAFFQKQPDGTFVKTFLEKGNEHVRVGLADRLVADSCVKCHNSRPDSPFREWKLGDVRGVLEVKVPIQKQIKANSDLAFGIISFFSGSTIFAVAVLAFVLIFFVIKPITELIGRLIQSVSVSESATISLRDSSTEISSSSVEQASAVRATVSALDEIKAMITKSRESVAASATQVGESYASATEGKKMVRGTVEAMDVIKFSNDSIVEKIQANEKKFEEIVKVISEIAAKTKVINDIVFQTKLLSFNASVEAARAGEHGKGFSVVAEEVGNLAQMSGSAAKEIELMLKQSIEKVSSIVKETSGALTQLAQQGTIKISEGIEITQRCDAVLDEVVRHSNAVKSIMGNLSEGFSEQSQGVANISSAMGEIDQSTQTNSDSAHAISSQAERLAEHALDLRQIMAELSRQILGEKTDSDEAAAPAAEVHHLANQANEIKTKAA